MGIGSGTPRLPWCGWRFNVTAAQKQAGVIGICLILWPTVGRYAITLAGPYATKHSCLFRVTPGKQVKAGNHAAPVGKSNTDRLAARRGWRYAGTQKASTLSRYIQVLIEVRGFTALTGDKVRAHHVVQLGGIYPIL